MARNTNRGVLVGGGLGWALVLASGLWAADEGSVVGDWVGKIRTPGGSVTLVLHVEKDEAGVLWANVDSPDQGAYAIPVTGIRFEKGILEVQLDQLAASYRGTLGEDGRLTGHWKQSGGSFPLDLERGAELEKPKRPQEPKPPFPYEVREVEYRNRSAGITIAGTLTVPRVEGSPAGPFPAVLLISGSGAQDRDEALMGHKPFLVLADHLTRQGIAVLRCDDRGVGKSEGDFAKATTLDFARDAEAGVAFLKTVEGLDPTKIGLIGHSEGGIIAPIVASRNDSLSFIVLLAGTGVNGEEVIMEQGALIARASGAREATVARSQRVQKTTFDIVKREPEDEKAKTEIRRALDALAPEFPADERAALDAAFDSIDAVLSPWFRVFLALEPAEYLAKVRCPVLALSGEKDLQVPPLQNVPPMKAALAKAGNSAATFVTFEAHNHLFQRCKTGLPVEYAEIEETMSPVVLEKVATWIREVVAK